MARRPGVTPVEPRTKQEDRRVDWFGQVESWLSTALLAAAALLGLVTIVMRDLAGIGYPWADGVIILFAILSAFVASSGAIRTEEHVRFDLLIARLPRRPRRVAEIVVNMLILVLLFALFVLNLRFLRFQVAFGGTSLETYLPQWLPSAGIEVALALMIIRYLQRLARGFRGEQV